MNCMNNRIVIITGVSASWKTTLQEEMLKNGWARPINFTTRKPRNEEELDEYVFLTKNQFLTKYWNWDFLEQTNYWWNFYGVSRHLPKWKNLCIVLDPVGRAIVSEWFSRRGIEYETYYLRISPETQEQRLFARGDDEEEVIKRKRDFQWFSPTNKCVILDGRRSAKELLLQIERREGENVD